jgi:bifunctional non-homologous end joining protein LigD
MAARPNVAISKGGVAGHKETVVRVDTHSLKLTRLTKPLYPSGFTKAQVIDYYLRVSPFILPHLKDRPVSLKRFPDGVGAQAFWEKDAPGYTPKWVRTFGVPRRSGGQDIQYIVIDDKATLAWTANLAALELHPFLHRVSDLNRPTVVVFDLDPGEPATILHSAQVGMLLRSLLKQLGLKSFAKVSGSKGIQVYVPLNSSTNYEITQQFARGIADAMEKHHPNLVVADMAKVRRPGKVFIDWSQNSDFKTTVAVYSLRAKREKPFVSMPVSWDELETVVKQKRPEALYLEPEVALARLEKLGDLFAPVLTRTQELPRAFVEAISAIKGNTLAAVKHQARRSRGGVKK